MSESADKPSELLVSLFERRIWKDASVLLVSGSFARAAQGKRSYESRHGIEPAAGEQERDLDRLMAAAGLAAVSLAERESWGWTLTTAGSPRGYFCAVEPEGMICARVREAPTDRRLVYLQRQKGDAPLVESHYEPMGNDPVGAVQRYFEQVEQTRTRLAVGDDLDCVLAQALPDGDFKRVEGLSDQELIALPGELDGDSVKRLDDVVLFYECRCTDEMILDMLTSLPMQQREEVWGDASELEIECPRCGRKYVVSRSEKK